MWSLKIFKRVTNRLYRIRDPEYLLTNDPETITSVIFKWRTKSTINPIDTERHSFEVEDQVVQGLEVLPAKNKFFVWKDVDYVAVNLSVALYQKNIRLLLR